jgi:sulfhydrogenase subunit alpha
MDLSLEEITKIEGTARVDLKIREGVVSECRFAITEMRRFFEEAVRGKSILALPQLLARICGTCSNAHLLASIASVENGLGLTVSEQTNILRKLLTYGLMIRDHGLHLYVFVLPDLFARESILAFDEHNNVEHELIHDCFAVKEAGNKLSIASGGRSVHAPFVTLGGFTQTPPRESLIALIPALTEIRPRILRLIDLFLRCPWKLEQDLKFLAVIDREYSFLNGLLTTSDNTTIPFDEFEKNLVCPIVPYSQAPGCLLNGHIHMVGALARMNLNRDALHKQTKRDADKAIDQFPSKNIFFNNLAQAIEMLHAVDSSIDLIGQYQEIQQKKLPLTYKDSIGIGCIEAPRGVLYHKVHMTSEGKVTKCKVMVPTAQNQIGIERAIKEHVQHNVDLPKKTLTTEIEKVIRAYDPCMSCATHFLKIRWK